MWENKNNYDLNLGLRYKTEMTKFHNNNITDTKVKNNVIAVF